MPYCHHELSATPELHGKQQQQQQVRREGYLSAMKCGRSKRLVTAMRPFPEGSSMVNTCPTNAGPPLPPTLIPPAAPFPPPAAAGPAISRCCCGLRLGADEEEEEEGAVEAEEMGRRSGTARCGAGDEEGGGGLKVREQWKGLEEEELGIW